MRRAAGMGRVGGGGGDDVSKDATRVLEGRGRGDYSLRVACLDPGGEAGERQVWDFSSGAVHRQ